MTSPVTAEHASGKESASNEAQCYFLDLPQELRDHIYSYLPPETVTITAKRFDKPGIRSTRGPDESVVLDVVNWREFEHFHQLYPASKEVQSDVTKYFRDHVKLEIDCSWYENEHPTTTDSVFRRPHHLLPSRFFREKLDFRFTTFIAIESIAVPDSLWEMIRARAELSFEKKRPEGQDTAPCFGLDSVKWESQVEPDRVETHSVQHAVTDFESLLAIRPKHLFGEGAAGVPFNPAHQVDVDLTQLTPDLIWKTQQAVAVQLHSDYMVTKFNDAGREREQEWAHVPIAEMIEEYDEDMDDTWYGSLPTDGPRDMDLYPLGDARQTLRYKGVDEAWKGMQNTVLGPRVEKESSFHPRLFKSKKESKVLFGRFDGFCEYTRY